MSAPAISSRPLRRVVSSDLPRFGSKLPLKCKTCGATRRYDVGSVCVGMGDGKRRDGDRRSGDSNRWLEESVYFSGYFHCRKCGAPGPWKLPAAAVVQLTAALLESVVHPTCPRIFRVRCQLFDGTPCRSAAEGEQYIKGLIARDPTDYFLWSRLGNLYTNAEQDGLAADAHQRAIELNRLDVESHYRLGCYLTSEGEPRRAAGHFHEVLRHARSAQRVPAELLHRLVRDSLESLFDLSQESQEPIDFLPQVQPDPLEAADEPRVLVLREMDLSSEEGWESLAAMFLPRDMLPRQSATLLGDDSSARDEGGNEVVQLRRPAVRTGRNEACPCGSGKKFKRCCGLTQD